MKVYAYLFYLLLSGLSSLCAEHGTDHFEDFKIFNEEIELLGQLDLPKDSDKFEVVVFVHGSGNIDRDGNQGQFIQPAYIKQISTELNKQGIGVLRYDKRTANPKNRDFLTGIQFTDYVDDLSLIVKTFDKDKRISGIHLLGHSQGSLVSALAIAENEVKIKSFISLCGPADGIGKVIVDQISAQNEGLGKIAQNHVHELMATQEIKEVNPFLVSVFKKKNQSFFYSWMQYDPLKSITQIGIPFLAIGGGYDSQVPSTDAEKLAQNTKSGKHHIINNMNHVLKELNQKSDNLKSYQNDDFQVHPQLVNILVAHLNQY
tara:strand:- start:10916 stop:11866 length:951 start_codon:yes stop_codon:yes gene_type:complete